jgi:hypothetical protein
MPCGAENVMRQIDVCAVCRKYRTDMKEDYYTTLMYVSFFSTAVQ